MLPLLLLLILMGWCLPAWSLPSPPHVLLLLPSEQHYPLADRRLALAISLALQGDPRFRVLPIPNRGGEERASTLARAEGATEILIADFQADPEPNFVQLSDVQGEYVTDSQVDVRLIDARNMHTIYRQAFQCYGEHPYASNVAEDQAFASLTQNVVALLRSLFPIEARLKSRSGREVTLDAGLEQGLRVGMIFARKTPQGHEGRLEITQVSGNSATGSIWVDRDRFHPGDKVIEQVNGSAPSALGMIRYQFLSGASFTGLALERNHSGWGWDGKIEFGAYQQGSANGPAIYAFYVPQFEWIPERLWGTLDLGAGGELLSDAVPGFTENATSFGLHGVLGGGVVAKILPSMTISLGLSYFTPWQLNDWSSPTGASPTAVASLPHLSLGGLGWRVALNWQI